MPSVLDDVLRRADEVVHRLCEAREHSHILETAQVELVFPAPREARANAPRRPRALRRIVVQFAQRVRTTRRNGRSSLVVEIGPAAANDGQKLRLRVEVAPMRGRQDPAQISVGVMAARLGVGTADSDSEELLTRTPVSARFDLMGTPADSEAGDESSALSLSSIQSLGPMLAELQHVWFQERERTARPRNVQFSSSVDLSNFWVSATSDESWISWQPNLTAAGENLEDAGRFLAALVIWRCIAALYVGDDSVRRPMRQLAGLPEPEEFFPKRPVDLNPSEVREHLEGRKLRLPWHVIEAACTSLNAGKHVIFTGPPGCGKTELAVELALFATQREREGLLVTASPAWSSSELVGRYIPRQSSYGLDFAPGFFLRAIRDRRWLIIDEFNRAPIDSCFGELFTVLAGQSVELPFEEHQPSGVSARIRVLPAVRDSAMRGAEEEARVYADYVVPPEFRIIGTMNDADRSELSRLSFALLRRFDIIRVDAPDADELARVIDDAMATAKQQTDLADRGYVFRGARGGAGSIFESLKDILRDVFVGEASRGRGRFGGLVSERVVGVATCRDVIAFVAEGLRAPVPAGPVDELARRCVFKRQDESEGKYHPRNLARSYLAMALVLKVFPQLEALDAAQRHAVIKRLTGIFDGSTFLRIEPVKDKVAADCSFEITSVEAATEADLDGDRVLSIGEYLVDEIRRQLRGTGEEELYADLLSQLSPDNDARDAPAQ